MTDVGRTSERPTKDVVGGSAASVRREGALLRFEKAIAGLSGPLRHGLRMWASAMLALYVAFELQLGAPYWAATTAIIVCQPQVGASLRKSQFRLIGTLTGATVAVVLTALFPQDRILFFGALALWIAICAFATTILRNFMSYGAALSGYTSAIVLSGVFDASGGLQSDGLFMHALMRATEISLGIASAGLVLALMDSGGAPKVLAATIRDVASGIMRGFMATLAESGAGGTNAQTLRRALSRQVVALDPLIDQTIGESSEIRVHSPALMLMEDGLISALIGWRTVDIHLHRSRQETETANTRKVLDCIAPELLSLGQSGRALFLNSQRLERLCEQSILRLKALDMDTPSGRLLADSTIEVFTGFMRAVEALVLLDHGRPPKTELGPRRFHVPDPLSALLNAGRAFILVTAVCVFWMSSGWPGGAGALTFSIVFVSLLGPLGDAAYLGSLALALGNLLAILVAAILTFAVLPAIPQNFVSLALALGVLLVPLGAKLRVVANPLQLGIYNSITIMSLIQINLSNPQVFSAVSFFNSAATLVAGCVAAAISFRLIPPFSPVFRARYLVAASRRDLSALAAGRFVRDWTGRMQSRILAVSASGGDAELALLLAILAAGDEIVRLRAAAGVLGESARLSAVLNAFVLRDAVQARAALTRLNAHLAADKTDAGRQDVIMRARASTMALIDAIDRQDGLLSRGAAR